MAGLDLNLVLSSHFFQLNIIVDPIDLQS